MQHAALVVELYEPEEACRFLAVVAIGLLTAVGNEVMTLAEAERLFLLLEPPGSLTIKVSPQRCVSS